MLAAVALYGCGAGGDPGREVKSAVNKTLAVSWGRYELGLGSQHLFPPTITVQGGRAAYDFRTGLGYEFLQFQSRSGSSQTLYYDYEPTRFLLAPAVTGALPAGKAWISAPLTGPGAHRVLTAQAEGLAPLLLLDEVAWGPRNVSAVGTRVVQSVPTQEYRVSVDLATARSVATKAGRRGIAAAIEQELEATPSGQVAVLVWVNGPGYVGKIESEVPGSGLGTVSFWFLSYVKPYTGIGPPASQVVPLNSLARDGRSLWAIATGS
ncbi:MAG TPA: hypothetical protein VGG41_17105 [Solirubrobacteraceae bacterium]